MSERLRMLTHSVSVLVQSTHPQTYYCKWLFYRKKIKNRAHLAYHHTILSQVNSIMHVHLYVNVTAYVSITN